MRKAQRQAAWKEEKHSVEPRIQGKYVTPLKGLPYDIHLPKLPVTSVGFTALRNDPHWKGRLPNLQSLLASGYTLIPWTAE